MKSELNYVELGELMRIHTERENCSFQDFLAAKDDLNLSISESPNKEQLHTLYNILRFLRNSCVQCTKNQTLILKLKKKYSQSRSVYPVKRLQPKKQNFRNSFRQANGDVAISSSRHRSAQPRYLRQDKIDIAAVLSDMMAHFNDREKDCLCMVIYNCILNREYIFEKDEEFWLFTSVSEFVKECPNTDWGLLIMELVISSRCFVKVYKHLCVYSQPRGVLLDFLSGCLSDDQSNKVTIPEDNILFLAEEFQTKATCILMLAKDVTDEYIEECMILVKVLSVLCLSTAFYKRYSKLREKETLLKSSVECGLIIDLLINMCGSGVSQHSDQSATSEDVDRPIHMLRCDLIRLIGNLCYKNQHFQTLTRQYNGIMPILNSCHIDKRNPFMMQWAIFAIRNLCDDNTENRELIKSLRTQGVATNKFLDDMKIRVDVVNDKLQIASDVVKQPAE